MTLSSLRFSSLIQVHLNTLPNRREQAQLRDALIRHFGHGLKQVDKQPAFFGNTGEMITRLIATGDGPKPLDNRLQTRILGLFQNTFQRKSPEGLVTVDPTPGRGLLPGHGLTYSLKTPGSAANADEVTYHFNPKTGKLTVVEHRGMSSGLFSANPQPRVY